MKKKNGEDLFIDTSVSTISIGNERLFQVSIRDITEKVKAEQVLKESEKKYRLITENINDLLAILNENLEYEYINEIITIKIMGYTDEDVIGKSALKLVHPEDLQKAKK